jgi:circadian clock protein KaiC
MSHKLFDIKQPDKIPTGIEGLEHITMGGLSKGRTTLIAGSSGSGKTFLAVEFLYRGVTQFNKSAVFVTLEELPEDVMRNVKKLGWHLDELVAQNKLRFIDVSFVGSQHEEIGSYDLSGLLIQIEYAIKEIGAELIVIDSIGSLFSQFTDSQLIRSEIFRISNELKILGVTSLITAERIEEYGPISRHGVEEFVSDNVIILRNVLEEERCRRTIQVLKVRGDTHFKGEFPFTITYDGISILPLSAMELKQASSSERIRFGNKELDRMAGGGLFRDSVILVSGPTGGGKTLMATIFTSEACHVGERVLFFAYEESREQLMRNSASWGVNFDKWVQEGLLRIICRYPEATGTEDHLLIIRREIEEFKPQRLVMDSVSAVERAASVRNFREFIIALTSHVKSKGICSLFTSTTPKLSGGESITEAHISTITDAIILLRYVEIYGVMRRGIVIIKMRGSQHAKEIYEFTIDSKGIHIGKPFRNVQNIILGTPSTTPPSEIEQLGEMFEQ